MRVCASSTDEKSTGPSPRLEEAVHHAASAAGRQVDGHALGAERFDEASEQRLQIELVGIDLVHHHQSREPALGRRLHHAAGDHLDPLPRVHDHRRGLHRRQHRQRPAEEVRIAGSVDEIHVAGAVIEVRHRGVQRVLVLLLLGVEVAHRAAVGDVSGRTDDTGVREQRLGQSRLSAPPCPTRATLRMSSVVYAGMSGSLPLSWRSFETGQYMLRLAVRNTHSAPDACGTPRAPGTGRGRPAAPPGTTLVARMPGTSRSGELGGMKKRRPRRRSISRRRARRETNGRRA